MVRHAVGHARARLRAAALLAWLAGCGRCDGAATPIATTDATPPTSSTPASASTGATASPLADASAPDAAPAAAASARPRDAAAERRWCLEQTKGHYVVRRDRGGEGNPFPRAPELDCREGFAWRASRFVEAGAAESWLAGRYDVAILHHEDDGTTAVVHTLKLAAAHGWGTEVLSEFTVGDVDGDNTPEVFWAVTLLEEGRKPVETSLMRLSNGAAGRRLEPVALPGGAVAVGLVDADRDGRFDVATDGVYATARHETAIGGEVPWFGDGLFLLRSLGGYRFDAQNPVSEQWTRAACARPGYPAAGPEPAVGTTDWRIGRNVVCARIKGTSKAEVERAIRAQCRGFSRKAVGMTECPSGLLDLAAGEPETRLTGAGP
jgi:hypothetical protein